MSTKIEAEKDYLQKLDDDKIHLTTRPYLDKVNSHIEPYEVDVFGKSITVLPGVMSPQYDWAGLYMIDCLPDDFYGQNVLELGPGSGLVSVFVGLRGAKLVTCADVNPVAVTNTRINLDKFQINSTVILSDVFSSVPKIAYDSIIFNLPYHDSIPANDLEKGVIDAGYQAMTRFLSEAKGYLKDGGKLYVGFSQSGNLPLFLKVIAENNLHIDWFQEKNTYDKVSRFTCEDFHYNCQIYQLSFQ
ncbi:MAG: methyltransferase [bacterium]